MTTVRVTDTLTHTLLSNLSSQFRPAINRSVQEFQDLTIGLLRDNSAAMTKMRNQPWGEHVKLREQIPEEWYTYPRRPKLYIRHPDVLSETISELLLGNEVDDDAGTISMAGFTWEQQSDTPAQDSDVTAPVANALDITPDTYEYDKQTHIADHSDFDDWLELFRVAKQFFACPPKGDTYGMTYVLTVNDICNGQDEVYQWLSKLRESADLEAKHNAARRGLKKILENVPSINRLLKEYPQFEPIIPDDVLRKVRQKVHRVVKPKEPVEGSVDTPDSSEMAALATASTLFGLND